MSKSILEYLFGDSQLESELDEAREDIRAVLDAAEGEAPIKANKTPLVAALKAVGVTSTDVQLDPEGFCLTYDNDIKYHQDSTKLCEPGAMEKLAELGWVVTRCGDRGMSNEPAEYHIRFLEIATAEGTDADKPSQTLANVMKAGREFVTTDADSDYPTNPVEHPDKGVNKKQAGVGDAKDGADPEGKPKTGKSESVFDEAFGDGNTADQVVEFFGRFGGKKKPEAKNDEKPKAEQPDDQEESVEEPQRYDDMDESIARRKGRPKNPPKDAPIAKSPKAGKVGKAYKTPSKAK